MPKDVVRFYVSRSNDQRSAYMRTPEMWLPVQDASRCLSFNDFDTAEGFLKWVVGNAWSSAPVPSYLGTFEKDTYPDIAAYNVASMDSSAYSLEFMRERVPKTPPASCVCVAIAFYPDPTWAARAVREDFVGTPATHRDIRVFVGSHGCGPRGPRFGDLTPQKDEDLVGGCVLRLAAFSALG